MFQVIDMHADTGAAVEGKQGDLGLRIQINLDKAEKGRQPLPVLFLVYYFPEGTEQ